MVSLKFLTDIQCCIRCCLRLSGETLRNFYSYGYSEEELVAALNGRLGATSNSMFEKSGKTLDEAKICPLCLDILKDHNLLSCIEKVTQKVKGENYDSDTFSINAMIPNSINIRQHSVSLFALENMSTENEFPHTHVSVKDAFKYGLISKIEEETGKKCDVKSPLRVTAVLDYKDENNEISLMPLANKETNSRKRKSDGRSSNRSSSSLLECLDKLTDVESMNMFYPCPPKIPTERCLLKDVTCFQESIFVGGRYNKYSRDLSQTPWFIDGVRKTETSLQELSCQKIQDYFLADEIKFVSAGREDVDVRMLGSGRPFAVELIKPRRTKAAAQELKKLQLSINNSTDLIAVSKLKIVSKNEMTLLKEGEEQKKKLYSATVYAKNGVSDEKLASLETMTDLVLAQKTPVRVLHRRPLSVRSKTIHTMSSKRIDDNHFKLYLSTQAGTYIKEFVHGDFQRTKPSLGTLLETETDILELDVEEIQLDWPPEDDPTVDGKKS